MKTNPNQISDESKAAFLEKLTSLWPVAKGSLCETRTACTYKGCKACASGRKHPRFLFTFREDGTQRGLYVRPAHAKLLGQAIANGRELERLITEAGRDLVLALREESKD